MQVYPNNFGERLCTLHYLVSRFYKNFRMVALMIIKTSKSLVVYLTIMLMKASLNKGQREFSKQEKPSSNQYDLQLEVELNARDTTYEGLKHVEP
ncbi:hypothetical protein CR513_34484, partial [Mucuna pruriens]